MRKLFVSALVALLVTSIIEPVSNAAPQTYYLGYQGPLTGGEAVLGLDEMNAVKYAIKKFNLANPNIEVKLIEIDDQGDPAVAGKIAPAIGTNNAILGIVGPAYSGATIASLPYYKAGRLTLISPSATRISLTDPSSADYGGPIFHRMSSLDSKQGPALVDLAVAGVASPKIYVVDDQSSYGAALASYVISAINNVSGAILIGTASVPSSQTDFQPIVSKIKAAGANVVIYLGYYSQAALFVKKLRENAITAVFAGGDGLFATDFIKLAGYQSEGARIIGVAGIADISTSEEANYVKLMGSASGIYAVESFDAANIFLSGILSGANTREKMLNYVNNYSGFSIKGNLIQFNSSGDLTSDSFTKFQITNSVFKPYYSLNSSTPKPSMSAIPKPTTSSTPTPIVSAAATATPTSSATASASPRPSVPSTLRQTTITCVKGKSTKIVSGVSPKCPTGYLRKI